MNRERLKMVRDRIAAEPPELLSMQYIEAHIDCRTVHCIGGWANVSAGMPADFADSELLYAQAWLDLTDSQQDELFYATSSQIPLSELTQADALAALDSLIHADSDDAMPIWPEVRP